MNRNPIISVKIENAVNGPLVSWHVFHKNGASSSVKGLAPFLIFELPKCRTSVCIFPMVFHPT